MPFEVHMKSYQNPILILDDQTVWKVDVFDTGKPTFWGTFDKLVIESGSFGESKIINAARGEIVKATKMS